MNRKATLLVIFTVGCTLALGAFNCLPNIANVGPTFALAT